MNDPIERVQAYLYERIIDYLSIKDRTAYEIRAKLVQIIHKKFPDLIDSVDPLIAAVQERLRTQKLVDDGNYVSKYMESLLLSGKAIGPSMVRKKLLQRGVSSELIDANIAKISGEVLQENNVLKLALRKQKTLKSPNKKAKLFKFLYQKGFDYSIIARVVDSIDLVD